MRGAEPEHAVTVRKIKSILTRFQARCRCGWESPLTSKVKAQIGKQVHEGGGEVVSWTKAKPLYDPCPECAARAARLAANDADGDLSTLPDVCPTCGGAGKVPAEAVH